MDIHQFTAFLRDFELLQVRGCISIPAAVPMQKRTSHLLVLVLAATKTHNSSDNFDLPKIPQFQNEDDRHAMIVA